MFNQIKIIDKKIILLDIQGNIVKCKKNKI